MLIHKEYRRPLLFFDDDNVKGDVLKERVSQSPDISSSTKNGLGCLLDKIPCGNQQSKTITTFNVQSDNELDTIMKHYHEA